MKDKKNNRRIQTFLDNIMVGYILIIIIALPLSLLRIANTGFQVAHAGQLLGMVYVIVVLFLKTKVTLKTYSILVVIGLNFIAIPGLFSYGLFSATISLAVVVT